MARPSDALSRALACLARGERSAFDEVFREAWPLVQRFCHSTLGDADQADDAAQAALLTVFREASDYDVQRRALPWILAIASWECASTRRRTARQAQVPLDEAGALEAAHTPESLLADARLRGSVDEVLRQLPERDRAALETAFGDEVARRGPLDAASRKRKQRALERLAALWRTLHGD